MITHIYFEYIYYNFNIIGLGHLPEAFRALNDLHLKNKKSRAEEIALLTSFEQISIYDKDTLLWWRNTRTCINDESHLAHDS